MMEAHTSRRIFSPVLAQTVNKACSYIGLTSSPDPSNVGQQITFTATAAPITSTGTATFYASSTRGTAPVIAGAATRNFSKLSAGNYSVNAVYSGDSNLEPSASPARIHVVKTATGTAVDSSGIAATYDNGASALRGSVAASRPIQSVAQPKSSLVFGYWKILTPVF